MKLTLRDLFWLVLCAAISLGWWASNRASQLKIQAELARTAAERAKYESAQKVVQSLELENKRLTFQYDSAVRTGIRMTTERAKHQSDGRLRTFPASDEGVDPYGPIKVPTIKELINDGQ
jgi:hypothetical protein